MSQFSGLLPQPPGVQGPVSTPYAQAPHPQSFNGYDMSGYGAPPSSLAKGFPGSQMGSTPGVQNGPAARPMQPFGSAAPPPPFYNQNIPSQAPPPSSMGTEQLSQRFGEMNMSQNLGYQSSPGPQRLSSGPENTRPPQPNIMHQPYSQQPPMPSSVSGPYRLSHPPIQHVAPSYTSGSAPPPGGMQNSNYQNDSGTRFQSGTNSVATPPPTMTSGQYGGGQPAGPPSSLGAPVLNDVPQNGPYISSPGDPMTPGLGMPPSSFADHANGHMVSPGMQSYPSQMPMQARYPPMSQPSSNAQSMAPQASQYPPQGMINTQNRMPAPMQPASAANQARRLDPDHMPSPIQVIDDDRKAHTGPFVTSTKGQVPPLVTTDFIVSDAGICSPRFMRSTIYTVPTSADILKQTCVPFAVVLSPFANVLEREQPPPISDLGESGPVRCIRCKAYMCPYMQFIDGGRRFQCVFCKATTEVPPEYFAHLDHVGERVDKYQRPELCLGSYEFVATKEYCKNSVFPKCPAFIFAIDVSYNSVRNGMVKLLCDNLKAILASLPKENDGPQQIKVGFITYSNVVQFYNIKSILVQPQVMVVPDVHEMFMPLLDGFLVDYTESEAVISSLLQQIPEMFADTRETETVLGPAVQAGLEALKAADCAGKLFVFHSSLPIAEAPGKLKNRDDRKLLGTEKEKTILTPQTTYYNNLGQECVAAGCCVDLFLFPNAYIDIATLGQVCRLTGGQLYKYTYFQADIDGPRFLEDLKRDVSKPIAFDAIIRIRTSTGIRPTDFWGNFFMSNTTDIEVAAIDCDKAIAAEIKFDDKLGEDDGAYIQAAILYTSCSGQRRLRLHNLALNTSSQMSDLFRNCELDTIMNMFCKEAIRMITEQTPRQVKDHYISRSAQILACYRKHCANRSSAGQLILPECMKLLPLYINCLIKNDAIAGGQDMTTDDRSFVMLTLNSMTIESSVCFLYPRLFSLHDVDPESEELPAAVRCSIEKIKDYGVYLIENGLYMFLWVGFGVSSEWLQDVFAVPTAARIDVDATNLMELNTPLSKRVRSVIHQLQQQRQRWMKFVIVRQGDKLEVLFRHMLVEDRTTDGSASYVDFLCHLHKEIRTLLT